MKKLILITVIAISFITGGYIGRTITQNQLLKPFKVEFTQLGEAGYAIPHPVKGILLETKTETDTVPHGGNMYLPTKYKYIYEIDPKDYVK